MASGSLNVVLGEGLGADEGRLSPEELEQYHQTIERYRSDALSLTTNFEPAAKDIVARKANSRHQEQQKKPPPAGAVFLCGTA